MLVQVREGHDELKQLKRTDVYYVFSYFRGNKRKGSTNTLSSFGLKFTSAILFDFSVIKIFRAKIEIYATPKKADKILPEPKNWAKKMSV